MALLDHSVDADYLVESRKKTLTLGRLFSVLAVLIVLLFSIQDLIGSHGLHFLFWRCIGFVPAILFLAAGAALFKRAPVLIVAFHAIVLFGVFSMACAIAYFRFIGPSLPVLAQTGMAGALLAVIFVIYIFAAGARRYLGAVVLPPLLVVTVLLLIEGRMDRALVTHVSMTWLVALACVAMAIADERVHRGEFAMRKLAQERKGELESEVQIVKELNEELNATLEALRKEIDERKAMEAVLEKRAAIDDLTGVYNRRAGLEILKQSIYLTQRYSQTLTLCFIDIDDLKLVNDNFGHPEGDELIKSVIEILKEHFRKSDYICRVGGDEFLVILTNCAMEAARPILERIKQDLAEQSVKERRYAIDISFGMSEYTPSNHATVDELLKRADDNMYINKQQKKLKQKDS